MPQAYLHLHFPTSENSGAFSTSLQSHKTLIWPFGCNNPLPKQCSGNHTMCCTNSTLNFSRVLPATRSRLFQGSCLKRLLMFCIEESQGWELHSVLNDTEIMSCFATEPSDFLCFLDSYVLLAQEELLPR